MNKKIKLPVLTLLVLLIFTSLACNLMNMAKSAEEETSGVEIPENLSTEVPIQEAPTEVTIPTNTPEPTATPNLPRTVTLNADGSGDYPTLQAAIADLVEGSTIILTAGNFTIEETLQINKSLTIQGAGKDQTNLSNGQSDGVFLYTGTGKLDLKGITFLYTGTESGQAAGIESGEFAIDDCRFTSTEEVELEEGRNGLFVNGTSKGKITNSRFDHNQRHGLSVSDQSNVEVENCEFDNNDSFGIRYFNESQGSVRNSTASNNKYGFGATENSVVLFEGNVANANINFGFDASGEAEAQIINNKSFENELSGIMVDDNAKATIMENELFNNVQNGVSAFDSGLIFASQNLVYSNQYHGFSIVGNAVATIIDNEINNSVYNAISFYDSSTGDVSGNVCTGNLGGIVNYGDQTPTIGENNCQ